MLAPFPYFGGKRTIAADVWKRFGEPKQYIEPFCGSLAILLAKERPCSLEVVCDANGFLANFWRAVKNQPAEVARWADYPVSHIDLGARHIWLMKQRERIAAELHDADWPGDAKSAGWWLWGQCCWIGSGWCNWFKEGQIPHASDGGRGVQAIGQIPHAGDGGRGVQAIGRIPHAGDGGRGVQAIGQIPHASDGGMGVQAIGRIPHASNGGRGDLLTSSGRTAWEWLHKIAARIERVRIGHGDWSRFLNHHHGKNSTAVFLDPPYDDFTEPYSLKSNMAQDVANWAREHEGLRIALCGHIGDYDMPGWDIVTWSRNSTTYGSVKTKDAECVWYSPGCIPMEKPVAETRQEAFL